MTPDETRPDRHSIACHLDRLLTERDLTLTELASRVGVTLVNLSVLKNNRARAIRFSTLDALCRELNCQPGDILSHGEQERDRPLSSKAAVVGDSVER